jgi:arylsulfatase A-like enzyme
MIVNPVTRPIIAFTFAGIWVLSCALARPSQAQPAAAAGAARPTNIILILSDDMGAGDLGCYGGTHTPTPQIDRLAREGTRFTRFYVAAPICSPSRAGIISGMFPSRLRITSYLQTRAANRGCEQADFLDPKAPALPRLLKTAGYATAHFGKWHLGGGRDVVDAPKFAAYGYDEHAGTYESPDPDPDITATNWIWSPKDKVKRWERTRFFVDKTLDFVARNRKLGKPCFVNLWPDDVHTPWVPGLDAPKGDTLKNLRGVLSEYDTQIGRLMDGLRAMGADADTLVIFASDNGALPTLKGARSAGYRGSKLSLFEGGIRMPFIVRWPGHVPAERTDDTNVIAAVDLLPTFCALTGASIPADVKAQLDGQDVSAALLGQGKIERKGPLFWEYGRNDKFFSYPGDPNNRSPNVAVLEGRWKLLVNADGTQAQLYDVWADPSEGINRATEHADVTQRLTERALAWRKSLP